jgi:SAM-dependent methyltransferase
MTANAAQAEAWNGDEGRHFVAERSRYQRMGEHHIRALLQAAAIDVTDATLDIGCGCGETTLRAAQAAARGRAVGVDLSTPMLAEARRLAQERGVGNVAFVEADAQTYPFPPSEFDVAISSFGLMFFDDPAAAFTNLVTALRPGGRLAFLCYQDVSRNEFLTVPLAAIATHLAPPQIAGPKQPGGFSLADPHRVTALLTGAGLTGVEITPVNEPRWMGTDVDDVVNFYARVPAVRSLIAGADEHIITAVLEELRSAVRPHQGPEGVILQSAAWLVTAHR